MTEEEKAKIMADVTKFQAKNPILAYKIQTKDIFDILENSIEDVLDSVKTIQKTIPNLQKEFNIY